MTQNWYAVYTKPRWEKKVAETLQRMHIENYCPLNKVLRQWSDRKKTVHEPLFKSYVFVHITDRQLSDIRKVDGILNFVNWLGRPAVIKDQEIETIKHFLRDHQNVRLEKGHFSKHDEVRIISGSLTDKTGTVIEIKNHSVVVALPSLGYILLAEIEESDLEKAISPAVKSHS
ncbi:UpxY family transcription antiterminator [Pontibacter sp. BT310]|uniref:UpxY family transcription antiterminator n=1 Tax=Pontibacter populi TaxID=890055 RepID=A0ABS6XD23_9BACT|nr:MULTISPECIES: UpxY family transcription antiterminator [Pontibacter]MBJ6118237.1 UpxY family transcription antiterminator [Pontibacter sp. BT310]MBR0570664.1 UpxY family transcription antiterminator [Microvirga sp. STS03]MBW3365090.1 UpxY family transcription antiterminator [Pontibacter populi]